MKFKIKTLVICFIIIILVAYIGSLFTGNIAGKKWYSEGKSSITPPNFVFPIAWSILFFLIALSLFYAWTSSSEKDKSKIFVMFGINFILNMLWSYLFFAIKQPLYAFIDLILLWISILTLVITTWKIDKKAAYLLIPYLLWVSFAGILNYSFAFNLLR